jgi:Domain of unknown function (DUF4190)
VSYPQQAVQSPIQPVPLHKGLSVASMVTGIIAAVFAWVPFLGLILGVIAVSLGGPALAMVRKGTEAGKGMAVTGLVTGTFAVVLFGVLLAVGVMSP